MINQLIFQRMITTMAAVLDAAALSNNWILIDRTTNRSAKSATAELLLELAMEQTDQRPTVLVIDTLERLHHFTSEKAKQQLQLLASLDSASFSPGECEDLGGVSPVEWPYAPNEYLDPADFYDKPLPRAPEEAHLVDGKVSDKRKWCVHVKHEHACCLQRPRRTEICRPMHRMYHYNQCFFGSGTHYIVSRSGSNPRLVE